MRLQKSLLPSAASTTPGVCDWRRIAHIFSLDRTPRGSTHAPTRRSGPCGASPVSLSLARPGLRSPVMVAAASKPGPGAPSPGCSPGPLARPSSPSFGCPVHLTPQNVLELKILFFKVSGTMDRKREKMRKQITRRGG